MGLDAFFEPIPQDPFVVTARSSLRGSHQSKPRHRKSHSLVLNKMHVGYGAPPPLPAEADLGAMLAQHEPQLQEVLETWVHAIPNPFLRKLLEPAQPLGKMLRGCLCLNPQTRLAMKAVQAILAAPPPPEEEKRDTAKAFVWTGLSLKK